MAAANYMALRGMADEKAEDTGSDSSEEQLLASLVESQQLGPALKAIFDRGWQDSYDKLLTAHIAKKDSEVKNICHSHYEEFISCIDNLITVKTDIRELREKLIDINDGVQDSGRALLQEAEELLRYRTIRRNINVALDLAVNCQHLLNLLVKATEQIEFKKYFSALKTLDQLQRHHLPQFTNHSFAKHIQEQIPKMILKVRDSVKSEFNTWLLSIKETSKELGALVMTQTSELLQQEEKKRRARIQHQNLEEKIDDSEQKEAEAAGLFDKVKIDFSPVYQCLHIYENLDMTDQFKNLYKESRRNQAVQAVELSAMPPREFLENYHAYFAQLAGFFAIEDSVLRSGNELLSRSEVEQLWEMAVTKLKVVLREHLNYMVDPARFLDIKKFVILFCKTMEGYGLHVTPLYEFLGSMREKYESLLFSRLRAELEEIFVREKYEPLTIDTPEEYQKFVLAYSLNDPTVVVNYPATLPFSLSCPLICRAMRNFIHDYYQYAYHLPDMEMPIRKAVDTALLREVNRALNNVLDNTNNIHISQPCQISINAAHLIHACDFFENYVTSFGDPRYLKVFKLSGREALQATRTRCVDLIMELIDSKIDAFMGLACNIDWLPDNKEEHASEHIQDLMTYLNTTFMCMQTMPEGFRQAIHFTSCKHIADHYMNLLLGPVKKFNIIAIYNLHLDVMALEEFAQSCSIPDLETKFAEIRQLINLFLSGTVEQILDQPTRQARFPQLNLYRLAQIMDKFKDIGMFARLPPGLPKLKKKSVEAVTKQLRDMAS